MKNLSLISLFVLFSNAWAYPDEWWKEIPKDQASSWEILPQQANRKNKEVILSKRTELGILSNFWATPFVLDGKKYASMEGFWQATKFPENEQDERAKLQGVLWPHQRSEVEQMSMFVAKDAGDFGSEVMKKFKIDWVSFAGIKYIYKQPGDSPFYQLIVRAMRAKLQQNPEVKRILLATGDLKLLPDHQPGAKELKAWQYFDIWMELRDELKKEKR